MNKSYLFLLLMVSLVALSQASILDYEYYNGDWHLKDDYSHSRNYNYYKNSYNYNSHDYDYYFNERNDNPYFRSYVVDRYNDYDNSYDDLRDDDYYWARDYYSTDDYMYSNSYQKYRKSRTIDDERVVYIKGKRVVYDVETDVYYDDYDYRVYENKITGESYARKCYFNPPRDVLFYRKC